VDVNDVLVFAKVAQAGSFSKAAVLLGMPVSTVSRRVAELESELGVPLLLRTTRSLKITEVGKAYLEHGRAIASELEKAEALANGLQSIPQGMLRITAAPDFGNQFLGKIVCEFLRANPRVDVDVVLTERVVDLIDEGFDLAIRIGELDDSTLMARKIGSLDLHLYASPEFLRKKGAPKTAAELSKFECIRFTSAETPDEWRLKGPRGSASVRVSGRVSSNNMELVREFAVSGSGIALMPHFYCAEDVEAERLRVVLPDWVELAGAIHVVYPGHRLLLPKVRVFVDHLVRSCSGVEWGVRR
jgi:DNA-binding transcriptional LysR family regulator